MRRVDREIENIVVHIKRLDEYLSSLNSSSKFSLVYAPHGIALNYNPIMVRFLEEHKSDLEQKLYRLASY